MLRGTSVRTRALSLACAIATVMPVCLGQEQAAPQRPLANQFGFEYPVAPLGRRDGDPRRHLWTRYKQDRAKMLALYKRACDGGLMFSCRNPGPRVDRDYIKAIALFKQARDGGEMAGCSDLGGMYQEGKVIPSDGDNRTRAIELYQRACDSGYMEGCENLGVLYSGQDRLKALALDKRGCDRGWMGTSINLGSMTQAPARLCAAAFCL
jgi:hypothetical protein